jgi:hypothetical protein
MTSNSPTLNILIVKPGLFILGQTFQLVLTELSRVSVPGEFWEGSAYKEEVHGL